ncbi:hypothetical protein BKA65DRAFT_166936 [Rhexocercosporidium sp. MPI-PUGE-AT-0058]|nr:hypothetical protein BKA65DRAFT_166936 [Rhexocercosporidium sp. MPI-PUGE-AT-0058]
MLYMCCYLWMLIITSSCKPCIYYLPLVLTSLVPTTLSCVGAASLRMVSMRSLSIAKESRRVMQEQSSNPLSYFLAFDVSIKLDIPLNVANSVNVLFKSRLLTCVYDVSDEYPSIPRNSIKSRTRTRPRPKEWIIIRIDRT